MTSRAAISLTCVLGLLAGSGCDESTLRTPDAPDASPDADARGDVRDGRVTDAELADAEVATDPERSNAAPTDGPFAGGARLQAVLAEASDGTALFLHWWDAELEVICKFEPMEQLESWRCLPSAPRTIYQGIDEHFADARCSEPLWRDGALPPDARHVVQRVDTDCWLARDYFQLGERFTEDVAYRKTEQGCMASAAPVDSQNLLYRLRPMALEAFVAASVIVSAGAERAAPQQLVADDGARAPHGFRDLTGDFGCTPRETALGMRCLPMSFGWGDRGGFFADAHCSVPAAVAEERCGGRHGALPHVLFADSGNIVTEVRRGGARLERVFEYVDGASCAAAANERVGFAIGERVALDSFLPAAVSRARRRSGLVQTLEEVSAPDGAAIASVARFERLATDALGGYECTLATTPDGAVRCVPPVTVLGSDYADPACTQPVWQLGGDLASVVLPSDEPQAPAPAGVLLPRIERVLIEASTYEGPVYARHGAECTLAPGLPNARQPYRRFAGEASLSQLPELSIVTR